MFFFVPLPEKVKDKIDEVLFMITILERIPTKFFKSIETVKGLFEIRMNLKVIFIEFSAVLTKGI